MDAKDAKDESTRLMKLAAGPAATEAQKREFYSSLFELAKYPDTKAKIQAGMFITSYFAEFPDLQEEAIDLVYDLCEDEDEKVRIQGIKSLAAVSEKDVAWLSRNTGVLLQLLACSANELTYVHKALGDLIAKSPAEVFYAMGQDCVVEPGEPTSHRSLVLNFVSRHALRERQQYLESGKYPKVEEVFAAGLLAALPTTTGEETSLIVSILLSMPHTADTTASTIPLLQYLCKLSKPSPYYIDSMAKLTIGKPCDTRYPLLFIARNGSDISMRGDLCIGYWTNIRHWQEKALALWQDENAGDVAMDGSDQDEVAKPSLVRSFVDKAAEIATLQRGLAKPPPSVGVLIEALLFSIYRFRQSVPEHSTLRSDQRRQLAELESWLRGPANQGSSDARKTWTSAKTLAYALSQDSSRPLPRHTPSWEAAAPGRDIKPTPSGPRKSLEASGSRSASTLNGGGGGGLRDRLAGGRMTPPHMTAGVASLPARPVSSTDSKRKFEEPARATLPQRSGSGNGRPSLLSRMESPLEGPHGKRSRGAPLPNSTPQRGPPLPDSLPQRPSLLARMSGAGSGAAKAAPVPINTPPVSQPVPPAAPSPILSIKGRSADVLPPPPSPVRLVIKRPVVDENEVGIIRKGRGFKETNSAPEQKEPPLFQVANQDRPQSQSLNTLGAGVRGDFGGRGSWQAGPYGGPGQPGGFRRGGWGRN